MPLDHLNGQAIDVRAIAVVVALKDIRSFLFSISFTRRLIIISSLDFLIRLVVPYYLHLWLRNAVGAVNANPFNSL